MNSFTKKMPWWLIVLTGVLLLAVGIFLLAANGTDTLNPDAGSPALRTLITVVGVGVLLFGLYCIFKALQSRHDQRLFLLYLIHGVLDIVLFLLILFIPPAPGLLGAIISCWMIVFGVFGMIQGRQEGGGQKTRVGVLLTLIGIGFLVLVILRVDSVLLLGLIALVAGIIRIAQGIIIRTRMGGQGSRPNLY
ncbi:MAG: DUF308 domain-containing protein [Christensenellales bacterium]|jgi:uncharacterized membrane protein HdeD (DUF308 family)